MAQFLSLFHEDVPVRLKYTGTEQVRHVMQKKIGMALDCKKSEQVHHLFHRVFVDNWHSFEF